MLGSGLEHFCLAWVDSNVTASTAKLLHRTRQPLLPLHCHSCTWGCLRRPSACWACMLHFVRGAYMPASCAASAGIIGYAGPTRYSAGSFIDSVATIRLQHDLPSIKTAAAVVADPVQICLSALDGILRVWPSQHFSGTRACTGRQHSIALHFHHAFSSKGVFTPLLHKVYIAFTYVAKP